MAYTTPPTFADGTDLPASDLNILGDDIAYLKAIADGVTFSGVQLRRTSTQSITSGSYQAVTWQSESGGFDIGSWWSSGTDIVVPAGAIPSGSTTIACLVLTSTNFASNATGTRFLQVLVNGTVTENRAVTGIGGGDVTPIALQDVVVVAAGDVITAEVDQSSGSTLTISGTNTKITVIRLAAVA